MHSRSILPAFVLAFFPAFFSAQNPCDTVQVVAQASATNLSCNNPVATLTGALHPSALSYAWSGPGGFSSNLRVAQNFVAGTYVLTVTGLLGCTAQTSVTVADNCLQYPLVPPECSEPVPSFGADYCWEACVQPYIPPFFNYNTAGYSPGPHPPDWCGTIENDQWFAFVAGAHSGTITAIPSNCTNGDGIQLGLYPDCDTSPPLACNGGNQGNGDNPVSITVDNLIIGKVYYLIVDGFAGDQCDFMFEIPNNICTAPTPIAQPLGVEGPSLICPNGTAQYELVNSANNTASAYLWTAPFGSLINGQPSPELFYKPEGQTVQITFGQESGFVCMRPIYYFAPPGPPTCFPVVNEPIPVTNLPELTICNEELPYELPWGELATQPGIYQTTLESYLGCDSMVQVELGILAPIFVNLGNVYRCGGDCFDINDSEYCETGSYAEVLSSYLGCDSTVFFNLLIADPVAEILGGGMLNCSQSSIPLSSAPSPGVKMWKNAAGQIIGNTATLSVTQPGLYILTTTLTIGGFSCQQADTILIGQDITPVQATAQGGTLTCSFPVLTLAGSASNPQATLSWSGPNGFTAGGPNPTASAPGDYYLIVTAPNGCSDTDLAVVLVDQVAPSVSTMDGLLSCDQSSFLLEASVSDPQATLSWFGPDGNPLTDLNVIVPGEYTIVATSANGCTATASTFVATDVTLPVVVASGGILTCINLSVTLTGGISDPQADFGWTGPDGFFSPEPNPTVSVPGLYTLTAISSNGCQGTATALVMADQQPPPLSLSADSVNCNSPTIPHVYAAPAMPNLEYAWTGPNGFTASEAAPEISAPGLYSVLVVDPLSGCTSTSSIEVFGAMELPDLDVLQVPPVCGDSLLFLDAGAATAGVQFHWTGPDFFVSDVEDPIVSVPGWYKVTAISTGGCEVSINILVVAAPQIPQIEIWGGTLSCSVQSLVLQVNADQPPAAFDWSGPGGFSSDDANPTITLAGQYQLIFSSANGCTATAGLFVAADMAPPLFSASGGTLTCAQPVVTLDAFSEMINVVFTWIGDDWQIDQASVEVSEPGIYTVVATSTINGCTATTTVSVVDSCLTGIGDLTDPLRSALRIYPNASSGVVFVEAIGASGFDALQIHAADGRLLLSQEYAAPQTLQRLDLTHWSAGVYPVSARIGSRWWTVRVVLVE